MKPPHKSYRVFATFEINMYDYMENLFATKKAINDVGMKQQYRRMGRTATTTPSHEKTIEKELNSKSQKRTGSHAVGYKPTPESAFSDSLNLPKKVKNKAALANKKAQKSALSVKHKTRSGNLTKSCKKVSAQEIRNLGVSKRIRFADHKSRGKQPGEKKKKKKKNVSITKECLES